MIARCDDRGLGVQCREFYDHMRPDVTVVIDMTPVTRNRFAQHFEWYPDGIISRWAGYLQPLSKPALTALATCDVVFSAETFYDPRLPGWLTDQDVRTVLQPNPELYRGELPSELWWPSEWLIDRFPTGRVMPVPVPDDRIADKPAGEGLFLHVNGRRALADRNGAQFLPWLITRTTGQWRITSQDGMRFGPRMRGRATPVGHVEDRWELYDGCSILVLPRRYGGLCLPVQEAMARGMAVVMTDCPPNRRWPIVPVEAQPAGLIPMPLGPVRLHNVNLDDLILQVHDTLANLEEHQQAGLDWAREHAWSVWEPKYRAAFEALP